MKTYFSNDLCNASVYELQTIINELKQINPNYLAIIEWNDDDSLYGVKYLDESMDDTTKVRSISKYELASDLLADVMAEYKSR